MKKEMLFFVRSMIVLIGLSIFYALAMITVYSISGDSLETNAEKSLEIINQETAYPHTFLYTMADRLDNFTDERIIYASQDDNYTPIQHSAMIYGRVQYWQGFVTIIRPLLMVFDWLQIRYISIFCFFGLLFVALLLLQKKLNTISALAFALSMVSVNILSIPICMQFVSVFNVMMIALIIFLLKADYFTENDKRIGMLFCVIGSVTNFFDFLTAPIITLTIPLAVILLYMVEKNKEKCLKSYVVVGIRSTFMWFFAYGVTFLTKWIYASVVFRKNMISVAFEQGRIRVDGENENVTLNRFQMLWSNVKNLVGADLFNCKKIIIILGVLVVIAVALCVVKHIRWNRYNYLLLVVAGYPYIWYFVMANHSQIHFWFTYRSQLVVIFVLLYFVFSFINKIVIETIRKRKYMEHEGENKNG